MGDIESPSNSTHYAMPISEVSFEELLMIALIMGPFLFCLTAAQGKGEGPSYKGLRLKKRR
jgi:hypothetical protein